MRGRCAVQLVVMFDCGSEGVLQNFSEDVFEMDRNIALVTSQTADAVGRAGPDSRKRSVLMSINYEGWGGPERCLGKFTHECTTHFDHSSGRAGHVDNTVVRCETHFSLPLQGS